MKLYKVEIHGDKWGSYFDIKASGWGSAVGKAIRLWQHTSGKGSRTEKLSIKVFRAPEVKTEEERVSSSGGEVTMEAYDDIAQTDMHALK